MARPNSEQGEQLENAAINVANTMLTSDTLQYVIASAYPGIEFTMQHDLVILRSLSEGGIQGVV